MGFWLLSRPPPQPRSRRGLPFKNDQSKRVRLARITTGSVVRNFEHGNGLGLLSWPGSCGPLVSRGRGRGTVGVGRLHWERIIIVLAEPCSLENQVAGTIPMPSESISGYLLSSPWPFLEKTAKRLLAHHGSSHWLRILSQQPLQVLGTSSSGFFTLNSWPYAATGYLLKLPWTLCQK